MKKSFLKDFLTKIQKLPESTRKIILWSIVIILGLILFVFWLKIAQKEFKRFQAEEFKKQIHLPQFQEKLSNFLKTEMPEIEIPEATKEEIKKGLQEIEKSQ